MRLQIAYRVVIVEAVYRCDTCTGCFAFWCPPCYWCALSSRMGEYYCGPNVFPCGCYELFRVGMRVKLRTMYGIKVSHNNFILVCSTNNL